MLEILPDFEILRNVELIFDGEIMRNTQEMPRVGVVFSMRLNEGQMFSLKFVGSATAAQRQMPHTRPNPRKLAHCNVIVGSPQEAIGFTMVTGESSQESHLSFFCVLLTFVASRHSFSNCYLIRIQKFHCLLRLILS